MTIANSEDTWNESDKVIKQPTLTTEYIKQRQDMSKNTMTQRARREYMNTISLGRSTKSTKTETKSPDLLKTIMLSLLNDDYVNIKGSVNLTIDSNCNMHVKGNYEVQVDGNKNEVIKGTFSQTVTGNVTETYSGNQTTKITGNLDVDAARIDLN